MRSHDEDPDRRERRLTRIDELIAAVPHVAEHKQMHYLREHAVGAHHSGQLPVWKLVIETLMTEGLLDAVFATSTVAAGVNFPARTILFLNSDRFNGRDFMPLTATEFHQMTGRAGRRGMDNIGFAPSYRAGSWICAWWRHCLTRRPRMFSARSKSIFP
ncbi:MAG: hypothetical protein R2861_15035 [Desulfobacterales bacterium]